jgi:hypothetical protein
MHPLHSLIPYPSGVYVNADAAPCHVFSARGRPEHEI